MDMVNKYPRYKKKRKGEEEGREEEREREHGMSRTVKLNQSRVVVAPGLQWDIKCEGQGSIVLVELRL